jgi:hypothetical protein
MTYLENGPHYWLVRAGQSAEKIVGLKKWPPLHN